MSSPLMIADGMLHRHGDEVGLEHLLGHAEIDVDGRILVPMIDVLAILRVDADAELLVVRHRGGAVRVLRLVELLRCSELFLQLRCAEEAGADAAWTARLWTPTAGSSSAVVSLRATSFASFVGLA